MSLQIDGNLPLGQQELQLQAIESFFVEVIDYQPSSNTMNRPVTSPVSVPGSNRIHLALAADSAAVAAIAGMAISIVFDRHVFVSGAMKRVVGFRG